MYYSHPCTYCTKIFYTYHESKEGAASVLYYGIKAHLIEYEEDHKEYQMDDDPSVDINKIYYAAVELHEAPSGGYEL